ncbi:MAG: hypothetical protein B6U69_02760 [Thermofilum sp. ex4484_15]|nr:MAG: hypothetical protein B6U69_02760 [Thermofilum sp. ex4484_15]
MFKAGMKVRTSISTLSLLGLANVKLSAKPLTAYLLQYPRNGYKARWLSVPQSSFNSSDKN